MTDATSVDFRAVFEGVPGLYLLLSTDLHIQDASDAYLRATKTRRPDIVGRHLFDVFPDNPDDADATGVGNLRQSLHLALTERRPHTMAVQKYDIRRPESEGGGFEVRYWSPVNTPIPGPDGEVRHLLHQVEDVTAFVKLREAEDRAHAQNDELRANTERMEQEIVRRGQEIQAANVELRAIQLDLERRVEERTAELRRTEEHLRHAQRLEAVGRLAGGIAHDFNNMLSVIMSFTELVQQALPEDSPERVDLEEVQLASRRAARLTSQLLAFSRQQVVQPRLLDLDTVVSEMDRMLRRLLGEDIRLTTHLRSDGARVMADPGHIEQVVANLAVNARDAMPRGGQLAIETGIVWLDEEYARTRPGSRAGRHLMIAVTDTGVGMTPDVQQRIFEPFFTTKEVGKGTGLGLSTVYGIAHQNGGSIWVYSEVGHGTTIKVYFPIAEGVGGEAAPTPAVEAEARGGSETILVAEDEDQVRAALTGILSRAGYRVLPAAGGVEALNVAMRHGSSIQLLLTDIVMPVLGGRELAERLTTQRPELPVLYMSGYTDDAVVRHGVLAAHLAYLQKPFTPDAVVRRVREVLDEAAVRREAQA